MEQNLEKLCNKLEEISKFVRGHSTNTNLLPDFAGNWHIVPLTPEQMSLIPLRLSKKIREQDIEELDANQIAEIDGIIKSLNKLKETIIPNLLNGNSHAASPPYMLLMDYISDTILSYPSWKTIKDRKMLPAFLSTRLEKIQSQIDDLIGDTNEFNEKVDLIKSAYEAAEELPATISSLKRSNQQVKSISVEAVENFGRIKESDAEIKSAVKTMREKLDEAEKLVNSCAEAYRITTSTGLAAAFDERAKKLNRTTGWWVAGLFVALTIGAVIGFVRIQSITDALNTPDGTWNNIWPKIILSIFSIGAPLWFAWLATKQIGQRFRLAEDYAFKASVAKAYEGYRREAARIDPRFEARLFGSALTRLEEPPLRLVEAESFGSPWHEFMKSEALQNSLQTALQKVPGLSEKLSDFVKKSDRGLPISISPGGKPTKQQEERNTEA